MTVIATDGRTMAGDGLTVVGYTVVSLTDQKVRRLKDGRIIGCSGNVACIMAALQWFEDGGDKPKLESFFGLVLAADGGLHWYAEALCAQPVTAPQALGCGADLALAAMEMGASPRRAVEVACKLSIACGGEIIELAP